MVHTVHGIEFDGALGCARNAGEFPPEEQNRARAVSEVVGGRRHQRPRRAAAKRTPQRIGLRIESVRVFVSGKRTTASPRQSALVRRLLNGFFQGRSRAPRVPRR